MFIILININIIINFIILIIYIKNIYILIIFYY